MKAHEGGFVLLLVVFLGVHLFMTRYILMPAVSKIGRVIIAAHEKLLRL